MCDRIMGKECPSTNFKFTTLLWHFVLELRHRVKGGTTSVDSEQDLDAMIQYQRQQQEKLAEEMVHLARNLKENAKIAGRIVQDDNKVGGVLNKTGVGESHLIFRFD